MEDLCTTCLSSDRRMSFLSETGFNDIFAQILNELPMKSKSPEMYPRVCYVCLASVRRFECFKRQAQRCYKRLHAYMTQSSTNAKLLSEPPYLQRSPVESYSYPLELKMQQDIKVETSEDEHCEPETFVNDLHLAVQKKAQEKSPKKKKKKIKKKVKKKKEVEALEAPLDTHSDFSDTEVLQQYRDKVQEESQEKIRGSESEKIVPKKAKVNGAAKEVLSDRPQCVECGKVFSSKKTYRYHLEVLHKGQNRYPCHRCGKVYQWKSNLARHVRSHKAKDSGELYCATCDKRFASVATHRQHLRVSKSHVSETDFSFMCNECGKKFVNKTRLRDHIDWEHLKKIKFKCLPCNKPFKCHTSLYVHMQNVHGNKELKSNLCHVCGKSYQNATKLKYHIIAMHTSSTPYRCRDCSAAFGWYSSLYRHVREVHYKMKLQPRKLKKGKRLTDLLPPLPPQLTTTQPEPAV